MTLDYHPMKWRQANLCARLCAAVQGGSAEEGIEDLIPTTNWSAVASRAGTYVPWLRARAADDPSHRLVVCIRPARTAGVRLEKELVRDAGAIIHNYGHGGSGFSLSWRCAEAVASLIERDRK
jgi:D-amino-acid oxidase